MRPFAFLAMVLPLLAQSPKPVPSKVAWTYESPRGFHLLEPAYRFPTQIKQALIQFVQPVPARCREYQTVFLDKRKFTVWLRGVLLDGRAARAKQARSEGRVISSDPSKTSYDGGTILSTAQAQPRKSTDQDAIEQYLDILKLWEAE